MKIGVDLRQVCLGASDGITQLVQGVFEAAFDRYSEHQFLVFCTPFNRSLLACDAEHVRYFSLSIASYFLDLDRIAAEEDLQVLFRSYPMEDTLQFPMRKQIVLIPDNQHETFPDFFAAEVLAARRSAFSKALGSAGAIGTSSEFSRKVLLDFPGTRCEDVFLMEPSLQAAHGLGRGDQALGESERLLIPDGEYFLFPANLWKHKNHQRLLQAFRLLRERQARNLACLNGSSCRMVGVVEGVFRFAGNPSRYLFGGRCLECCWSVLAPWCFSPYTKVSGCPYWKPSTPERQ